MNVFIRTMVRIFSFTSKHELCVAQPPLASELASQYSSAAPPRPRDVAKKEDVFAYLERS